MGCDWLTLSLSLSPSHRFPSLITVTSNSVTYGQLPFLLSAGTYSLMPKCSSTKCSGKLREPGRLEEDDTDTHVKFEEVKFEHRTGPYFLLRQLVSNSTTGDTVFSKNWSTCLKFMSPQFSSVHFSLISTLTSNEAVKSFSKVAQYLQKIPILLTITQSHIILIGQHTERVIITQITLSINQILQNYSSISNTRR